MPPSEPGSSSRAAAPASMPTPSSATSSRSDPSASGFSVATAATYIMSTEGATDTVLALHGPGDPGAMITWDDDRGRGANARIVRKLQPGEYWLTVRHKAPAGSGSYSVTLKKRK